MDFAKKILDAAILTDAKNADEVKQIKVDGVTVQELINEQIGVIGEKIDIPFYVKDEAEYIESYVHMNNKLASLVLFNKKPADLQIGKDICMQVVAMNPVALDKDDVPEDIKEKELEIAREQAKNEGKPDNIIEKIAMGRLNKFYQEATLLNQQFIKDHKKSVKDYIKENDKDLTVIKFYRFSLAD
jgi:elongation factor Ts